jgi:hypothetical protein
LSVYNDPWGTSTKLWSDPFDAQTIAITGRSYRLKDHATVAGKEEKNKKSKTKPNEPSTAEPAS